MTFRSSFGRIAAPVLTLVTLGALAAGCSSGASQSDEWTGSSDSKLLCQGAGIHPENCVFQPPPPPPPPVTDYAATVLAAPFAGCTVPELLTETNGTTGALMTQYFTATCPSGAAATAWVAAHASWSARLATTRPLGSNTLTAPTGDVFLDFVPPTPTTLPSQDNTSTPPVYFAQSNIPVDYPNTPPCTDMFFSVPSPAPQYGNMAPIDFTWVAYCVDTPEVDALAATMVAVCASSSDTCTVGESATAGENDMPPAAYGYTYIYADVQNHHNKIGGGCSSGCFHY